MSDSQVLDLPRKYRPQSLDEICGQLTMVNTVRKWFKVNQIPQIIALFGTSGCGKTTAVRIIAKELGAESPWDYREINIADDRGIDAARGVIEELHKPSIRGKGCNRVFFLDEIQSMSKDAQNALLKPLEEIRQNQYVIFSTTNPEKIIAPLKNRAVILNLTPLSVKDMETLLDRVLCAEDRQLEDTVRKMLLESSGGSPRQMLSTLQRVLTASKTENQLATLSELTGVYDDEELGEAVRTLGFHLAYTDKPNPHGLVTLLTDALANGIKPESIRMAILGYIRGAICKNNNLSKLGTWSRMIKCFSTPYYGPDSNTMIYADVLLAVEFLYGKR